MAPKEEDVYDKLGSRDPVDYDVLVHFRRTKRSLGNLKFRDGIQPELLQAIANIDQFPERMRNRLWSLEAERQCTTDAPSHDLIEFEQFKLLDYWTEYGMAIAGPSTACDSGYAEQVQNSLLRLCLQLNRNGFRGSDASLFISHYAQIDVLVAAIKQFRNDPSLFPDKESKETFWRIVLKCQTYLKKTKSASYLERVHRSSISPASSNLPEAENVSLNTLENQWSRVQQSEESPSSPDRLTWHQFLHRDAPITKAEPPLGLFAYTQIVPPGGQKILEGWDWEYQNERASMTNDQWEWKYGYAGLAKKKIEKTLFGGTRLVELVSDTGNPDLQKLKDIEGRLIGTWKKRHDLETFTFCTRNWLEEHNPADAVLNDFLYVHKIDDA